MIRCFRRNLLSVFCFAIVLPVQAQITGNLNVKDPKALEITAERIQMLCGKTWWGLQINETKRGEKEKRDIRETIKFLCNGEIDGKYGKWEAINSQFLQIKRSIERKHAYFIFNGPYYIYEISDSTLVLAQVLTSNGDWVKELMFTSSQDKYHDSHPRPNYANYWPNDQRPGEKITRYDNGNIASKEYYKAVKRKLSVTELFEFGVPPNLTDSTRTDIIPIGHWTYYYPDGKLKSISHYDSSGHSTGNSIRYFSDGKIDQATYRKPNYSYSDYHEYSADGSLLHVKRQSRNSTLYVIGKRDSVAISEIEVFVKGRAQSTSKEKLKLFNLGSKETIIKINENKKLGASERGIVIKPADSLLFDLPIIIPQGGVENFLTLSTNEWNYKIKIHSFGFDLTTSDFESEKSLALPSTFYFYLEPEGYQLEITPLSNPNKKKTIPISQQLTEIQLKKDKYHFTLYSPSVKRTISVEVK
jgi:hypothetical protein